MSVKVTHNFNVGKCLSALGVEKRGRVQRRVANEILRLSGPYIPFDQGGLSGSGHIEGDTDVVWNTPYAQYQWNGIVYEDPKLHCAGFKTENGWRSRKGVQKVPTARTMEYRNGNLRGSHWADRMLQNGGLEQVEQAAREEMKR
ncbi:MAG: minor capsid protein [bacterium]|nr:minor capsid protein [bacterium]